MTQDEKYMRYALQLASRGGGAVSPNPMVGAVIVAPGRGIIGRGWHRRFGEAHAEVNAVNSVKPQDMHLLPESTIYVTLEPCSHYGKTPPCSLLLIEKRFKRVVVGMPDPFVEVSGRGIAMLRNAGIEVDTGILEQECRLLNRRFVTAHTLHRPHIMLKWAQSADRFIAAPDSRPVGFSNPLSLLEMHRLRSLSDAILVGTGTIISDNPELSVRQMPGNSPRPVIFDSARIPKNSKILSRNPILLDPHIPLAENMNRLYSEHKITSLMVEGGAETLRRFMDASLFDEIRIETAPLLLHQGIAAPAIPSPLPEGTELVKSETRRIRDNEIHRMIFRHT